MGGGEDWRGRDGSPASPFAKAGRALFILSGAKRPVAVSYTCALAAPRARTRPRLAMDSSSPMAKKQPVSPISDGLFYFFFFFFTHYYRVLYHSFRF